MIVVIATIECKKDSVNYIQNQLCKLVVPTLMERGCLFYKFYQDLEQPNFFHSFEIWISQNDIDNHMNTNHIKTYLDNTKNFVTEFKVRKMNQLC